jgi:hypothetical protein
VFFWASITFPHQECHNYGRTFKHCYSHVCSRLFIKDIFPFQTTIVDWNDDDKVRIGMNAQLLKVVIAILFFWFNTLVNWTTLVMSFYCSYQFVLCLHLYPYGVKNVHLNKYSMCLSNGHLIFMLTKNR